MKTRAKICAAIASAFLVGTTAATAQWVRSAPDAQTGASDGFPGLRIPLRPAKPYLYTGDSDRDRAAWISEALQQMRTIHAGSTRRDLDNLFEGAGGLMAVPTLSAPGNTWGEYSYRDCPNFKVDVEFQPARKAETIASGNKGTRENPDDVIVKISRPFVDNVYSD